MTTREEFAQVIYYLAAAVGREVSEQQLLVYYDLLGDLPFAALQAAARQALLESQYPTLPTPGTLRKLATAAIAGPEYPPAAEAYRRVLCVVNASVYEQRQMLAELPCPVRQAAEAMGLRSIGDSTNPETCRAQFTRAYEAYVRRAERETLLPAPLRAALATLCVAPQGLLVAPVEQDEPCGDVEDYAL